MTSKTKVRKYQKSVGGWSEPIEIFRFRSEGDTHTIVLRKLEKAGHTEYVTHYHAVNKDSYFGGHYFTNLEDAREDFWKRVEEEKQNRRYANRD